MLLWLLGGLCLVSLLVFVYAIMTAEEMDDHI